jgi:hypothetical protein
MPDALHLELYRDRRLLADLMQCGVAMRSDALSWCTQVTLEAGYVVVLETAGRSGHWHPHLPILMTSGGVTSSPWLKPGVSHPWGEHQMLCLLCRHLLTSPWLKPGASRRTCDGGQPTLHSAELPSMRVCVESESSPTSLVLL